MRALTKNLFRRPGIKVFYGWKIVFASFIAHLGEGTMLGYALGIFLLPMTQELGWSRSQLSGAITLGSLLGGSSSMVIGRWVDRYGPRGIALMGALVLSSTGMALGAVHQLWHFYILYPVGRAAALSALGLGTSVPVANWFVLQRGRALAISGMGVAAAGVLIPVFGQLLINHFGWRWAWVGLGISSLALITPAVLLLRRRPEDMGLHPDGLPQAANPGLPSRKLPKSQPRQEPVWTLRGAIGTRAFWLLALAVSIGSLAGSAILLHQVPFYQDRGISRTSAATILSVYSLVAGISRLLWGFVVERLPVRYALAASFLGSGVSMLILTQVHGLPVAYTFATLYGLFHGGWGLITQVAWANYFGRQSLGSIQGTAQFLNVLTMATGPLLTGLVFDLWGTYVPIILLFATTFTLAAFFALFAKPPQATQASD